MEHPSTGVAPSLRHYLLVFATTVVVWLLLAGSLDLQEGLAAVGVGVIVTLISGRRLAIFTGVRFSPAAPFHLLRYLLYFLMALVRANLDMARRVLSPSLPLSPAVVEVHTDLKSSLGRLLLANSITLTPGTLSIDVRGDRILVHWVDSAPGTDLEAATRSIAASFESRIRGFLK